MVGVWRDLVDGVDEVFVEEKLADMLDGGISVGVIVARDVGLYGDVDVSGTSNVVAGEYGGRDEQKKSVARYDSGLTQGRWSRIPPRNGRVRRVPRPQERWARTTPVSSVDMTPYKTIEYYNLAIADNKR